MLKTEMRNPKTTHIDKMSVKEMLKVIQEENYNAFNAVTEQLDNIEKAVELVAKTLDKGGRLIYMGAGTSGRIGVLDASECFPTFGVPEGTVVGLMAGGYEALYSSKEDFEDSKTAGAQDLKTINLKKEDVVAGISAAGGAGYVINGLEYAKTIGCSVIGITSNKDSLLDQIADVSIVTDTGAEVVTGSTRMKAGTAQKLVVNMISTGAMIKTGKVYENLMVNLSATNEKLKQRMISILCEIKKISSEDAEKLLCSTEWNLPKALDL